MLDEKLLALNESWLALQTDQHASARVLVCASPGPGRQGLVDPFRAAGLNVTVADTADAAVSGLELGTFDLLVVSDDLPDLPALDLVRFVQGHEQTPDVIVLAREPDPRQVLQAIQLGVAEYLLPPEQDPAEVLDRATRRLVRVGRAQLQVRMLADLRALHQSMPPEERGALAAALKEDLERSRRELGPQNRVLVVEPDASVRQQLCDALGSHGLVPAEAASAAAALPRVGDAAADLVVAAAQLPDLDFGELRRRIEDRAPGLPVVLLAGMADLDLALGALRQGVADWLRKPLLSPDQAAHRLARLLRERRRELLGDRMIQHLYRLIRSATIARSPAAVSRVDVMFEDVIAAPSPRPPARDEAAHLAEPLERTTSGSHVIRLTSGEMQVIAEDGHPDLAATADLPDTIVIEYIDDLLFAEEIARDPLAKMRGGRRLTPRVERTTYVRFGPTGTEHASLGYAHDLSLGGLFILSGNPPPLGTDLQLELQISVGEAVERVRVQGRVAWHTSPERMPPQGAGFGVQFTVVDRQASAAILRAVTH